VVSEVEFMIDLVFHVVFEQMIRLKLAKTIWQPEYSKNHKATSKGKLKMGISACKNQLLT
jgi:hypothetical protein